MKLEFTADTRDLRNAIREIKVNRGGHSKTDIADILVSEIAATLCSVGTEAEIPVNGKQPGSARLPLPVLDGIAKVVRTLKQKNVPVLCEAGIIKVGTFSFKHPNIEVGIIPDRRVTIPIDLSLLHTLALCKVLTPQQLLEQGLRERIEEAQRQCSKAIAGAVSALQELGVDEKQIKALVEMQVAKSGSEIRFQA